MASQKAIVVKAKGDAQCVSDRKIPSLRPGYVLVKVKAVALNPTDWKHIDYLSEPGMLIGVDYAGVVEKTGHQYTRTWKEGDKICGFTHGGNNYQHEDGAFAEHIVVKADIQMRMPEKMSFEEGATLGVGIVTVGQGLYQALGLNLPSEPSTDGTPVLIYGGSTATGALGLQFLKLSGYKPITTCGPHNAEYVESLGAEAVFNYKDDDCAEQIKKYTGGKLMYAWDCIGDEQSAKICSEALAEGSGTKYATIIPVELPRKDIKNTPTLAYSSIGEPYDKGFAKSDDNTADFEFQKMFIPLSEKLVAQGKVKVHRPKVMDGGFEQLLEGLDHLRKGKVSGVKYVYPVA